MKYLIGMDGGGTKTHCIITDMDLNVLHECTGGPSNFLMIGSQEVSETLLNLIDECKSKVGFEYNEIESIVLGTTGAGRKTDQEVLENDFKEYLKSKNISLPLFSVESDARIALEGAFSGHSGSILIAGTGSIMFGKDSEGNIHRVGGFGRFIGDEGSGFMLGRKGLIALAKSFDGRGEETKLGKLVKDQFGIDDPSKLITEIYKNKFDIASVAPLVMKAAENSDEICDKILEEEAEELVLHIQAMKKLLNEEEMQLSLIGSTITTDNYYANKFKNKAENEVKGLIIKEPENPPSVGAAIMAKNKLS
jgi:N-acetylglucosamine kinase-like BadF-type ATPase